MPKMPMKMKPKMKPGDAKAMDAMHAFPFAKAGKAAGKPKSKRRGK